MHTNATNIYSPQKEISGHNKATMVSVFYVVIQCIFVGVVAVGVTYKEQGSHRSSCITRQPTPKWVMIQENCKPGTNSLGSLQAAPQYKHLSLLFGCQCLCPQQWFIPVDPLGRALRKLQTFCSKAHVSFYDLLFTS